VVRSAGKLSGRLGKAVLLDLNVAADIGGTSWVGTETANDTTNVEFVFKENGSVTAYDDTANVWTGTWRKTSDTRITVSLTTPNAVNYSGTIEGNRMSGTARRPDTGGRWTWNVTKK
jgi:hypothetical protein